MSRARDQLAWSTQLDRAALTEADLDPLALELQAFGENDLRLLGLNDPNLSHLRAAIDHGLYQALVNLQGPNPNLGRECVLAIAMAAETNRITTEIAR